MRTVFKSAHEDFFLQLFWLMVLDSQLLLIMDDVLLTKVESKVDAFARVLLQDDEWVENVKLVIHVRPPLCNCYAIFRDVDRIFS